MKKIALGFLTKDKVELSLRSIEPLIDSSIDLFWIDGSTSKAGQALPAQYATKQVFHNVGGGPDAAIVFALTMMLNATPRYEYLGLCEQDVLLEKNWLQPTLDLFTYAYAEKLGVGAVSARSYQDRILIQRDGFAIMHNLGAGMVIFTRLAAQLILDNYRNPWSTDNRAIFAQLCGIDIGRFWAFRGSEQFLSVDWGFDATLARHGLASLALTPSKATMLDQDIAAFGLKMADGQQPGHDNRAIVQMYAEGLRRVRAGEVNLPFGPAPLVGGAYSWFPHQMASLGGVYHGDWGFKWSQGYGPFSWVAGEPPSPVGDAHYLSVPVFGPCEFVVSGGEKGGRFRIHDPVTSYDASPELKPEGPQREAMTIPVPGGCAYRNITLTALDPGVTFYALRTMQGQPWQPRKHFGMADLPVIETVDNRSKAM